MRIWMILALFIGLFSSGGINRDSYNNPSGFQSGSFWVWLSVFVARAVSISVLASEIRRLFASIQVMRSFSYG